MDDELLRLARSFGSVADSYDRGRPSFPEEAAAWLTGTEPATVLELGAGTGKLTSRLVALGHDVHATEPDPEMLAILKRALPDVPTSQTGAEEIPLPDGSVDVVVSAQAFHWFDHDRALPEIARVLRPGGWLALTWNFRDARIPWVRKLSAIIGDQDQVGPGSTRGSVEDLAHPLVLSDLFGFVEEATFAHWQEVNRESIVDLVASRSNIATLDDEARALALRDVLALYDDYGRGMDGMQLPYSCRCFKAVVADKAEPIRATGGQTDERREAESPDEDEHGPSDGTDTDMLLIDFR